MLNYWSAHSALLFENNFIIIVKLYRFLQNDTSTSCIFPWLIELIITPCSYIELRSHWPTLPYFAWFYAALDITHIIILPQFSRGDNLTTQCILWFMRRVAVTCSFKANHLGQFRPIYHKYLSLEWDKIFIFFVLVQTRAQKFRAWKFHHCSRHQIDNAIWCSITARWKLWN